MGMLHWVSMGSEQYASHVCVFFPRTEFNWDANPLSCLMSPRQVDYAYIALALAAAILTNTKDSLSNGIFTSLFSWVSDVILYATR